MWLAIALEVDQTFEAYWREAEEMKHYKESDIYWGIRMGAKYTKIYRDEKSIVADKEPHDFDWLSYPDNWTYKEHLNWRKKQGLG